MIVDIFIPCYIDQYFPNTAMNMVKVLERVGCGVNYNAEQTCCGMPAFHAGYRDQCKEVATKLVSLGRQLGKIKGNMLRSLYW